MGETLSIPKERIPELAKALRISTARLTEVLESLFQEKPVPVRSKLVQRRVQYPSQSSTRITNEVSYTAPIMSRLLDSHSQHLLDIPEDLRWYIECWYKHDLPKHRSGTKALQDSLSALKKLTAGTFFNRIQGFEDYKNYPFNNDDWLTSVSRFALARNDSNYRPNNKKSLKTISVGSFIYSPYINRSYFIQFLKEEPQLMVAVKDTYPLLTSSIIKVYSEYRRNGFTPKKEDMVNAIRGAHRLHNFFRVNQRRIAYWDLDFGTPIAKAKIAMDCLEWLSQGNEVQIHFFNTEGLYDKDLPRYLSKVGVWQN